MCKAACSSGSSSRRLSPLQGRDVGDAVRAVRDRPEALERPSRSRRAGRLLHRGRRCRTRSLAPDVIGIDSDGWTGADATYTQWTAPYEQGGYVRVKISRAAWTGQDVPSKVTITVSSLRFGLAGLEAKGVTSRKVWTVHSGARRTFLLQPRSALPRARALLAAVRAASARSAFRRQALARRTGFVRLPAYLSAATTYVKAAAKREPGEGPLRSAARASAATGVGSARCLRNEERTEHNMYEPAASSSRRMTLTSLLPRIEIEDELSLRVGTRRGERTPVGRARSPRRERASLQQPARAARSR